MSETALLVREAMIKPAFTKLTKHQHRVEAVLGRGIVKREAIDLYKGEIETFYEVGFRVIVKPSFACRFRYSTALMGECVGEYSKHQGWLKEVYHYIGDVPEFVLDRLELIERYATARFRDYRLNISLHSQSELPMVIEKIPRKVDPVAIWWWQNPLISKKGQDWKPFNPTTIGAIIAIWDMNKEVKILES